MSKRPRSGPSPTVIRCEKQPNGSSRCCTFKRGAEDGEPLRCFTSQKTKRSKRGGTTPPEE